jgi:glucan phosphoethanolaminetransferase (alkaline phosphatase superfamily)
MMFLELVRGIFTLANAFIAVFIVVYAFLFLKKTKSHYERRPWDYLFMASIIYLTYTMALMLLTLYNIQTVLNLKLEELNIFFQFLYTGLILLAFISQTDLIFKNEIIVITRKLEPSAKIKLEEKIEKDLEQEIKKKEAEMQSEELPKAEEPQESEESKPKEKKKKAKRK